VLQSACYLAISWYTNNKLPIFDIEHATISHTMDGKRGDCAPAAVQKDAVSCVEELEYIEAVWRQKEVEVDFRSPKKGSYEGNAPTNNFINASHPKSLQDKTRDPSYQHYSGDLSAFSFPFHHKPGTPRQPYKSGRTHDPNYKFYSGDFSSFDFSSLKQPRSAAIAGYGTSTNNIMDSLYIADAVPYVPPEMKGLKRTYAMQDLYAASVPSLPSTAFATLAELPSVAKYSLHSNSGVGSMGPKVTYDENESHGEDKFANCTQVSRPQKLPKSKSDPKAVVRRLEVIHSDPEEEFFSAKEDSEWEDDESDNDEYNAEKRSDKENDSGVVV